MLFDEKADLRGALVIEPQPFTDALGDARAFLHVTAAVPFADVVQQQAEIKRRRIINLVEDLDQSQQSRVVFVTQAVERFDGLQRVLVNRVLVIKVVLDEKGDAGEFGQQFSKKSGLVHHPQHHGDAALAVEDVEKSAARFL